MVIRDKRENVTPFEKPVIFFDGVCGLCSGFVDFIISRDVEKKFYYAPLQGETAKRFFPDLDKNDLKWSVYYVDEQGIYELSTALIKIAERFLGRPFGLFIHIPLFIRDGLYKVVASNRYRWFGKRGSCRAPSPEERDAFLD